MKPDNGNSRSLVRVALSAGIAILLLMPAVAVAASPSPDSERLLGVPDAVSAAQSSDELHPSWSPDGERIVFESDREGSADLWVIGLMDAKVRRLTDSPAADARPVWSPDGRWIAFHSDREENFDLWAIRPDGTGLRRLTSGERDETNPAWDPTSKQIVYEERAGERTWHLRVVDTETLATRPLVVAPGSHLTPSWMASGKIAYSYSPPGGNHDTELVLRVVEPDGRDAGVLLAGRRGNSNAQYSAALQRLVFNSIRDGNWEIYSARPEGHEEQRLTASGGEGLIGIDGQPDWSPTSDRIAITSGRAGSLDIVILTVHGEEIRNLTKEWTKPQ